MQTAPEPEAAATADAHVPDAADGRRPGALDVGAAILLVATVVLHVVAMMPTYFVGSGSLTSQADQAALYSVLAAAWALALGVGLTGPHRTPVAAALAAGVAAAELGFRVADVGDAIRYGTSTVGAGLWLMTAAWAVGAAAAVLAVLAARSRHAGAAAPAAEPAFDRVADVDWSAPVTSAAAANPYAPGEPVITESAAALPSAGGPATAPLPSIVPEADEDPHERLAWTVLVLVLAAATAGAFLPAWDHAVASSPSTGQTVTRSLGNAFSGPWQQVTGTVLAAVAILAVPAVAVRLRRKAIGAAAVAGSLLVLASQLVAAVVQVDEPVPASDFGLSTPQARELGLSLSLKLTGWFTIDALAAYALFAAVMVWATLRVVQQNSPGTVPRAPERRSEAMPSAS